MFPEAVATSLLPSGTRRSYAEKKEMSRVCRSARVMRTVSVVCRAGGRAFARALQRKGAGGFGDSGCGVVVVVVDEGHDVDNVNNVEQCRVPGWVSGGGLESTRFKLSRR